ncbi:MAG: hypothetical protein Q8N18_21290 [Opitutaceae bacterium]|nr:hypothetical protein [Opitutaceae bacterium]
MTASLQHPIRSAGPCPMQGQQRWVAPRAVVFSVWNKFTGPGTQN